MSRFIKTKKRAKSDKIWVGQRVQTPAKTFGGKWAAQNFPGNRHAQDMPVLGTVLAYTEREIKKISSKVKKSNEWHVKWDSRPNTQDYHSTRSLAPASVIPLPVTLPPAAPVATLPPAAPVATLPPAAPVATLPF